MQGRGERVRGRTGEEPSTEGGEDAAKASKRVSTYRELRVYNAALDTAMAIFELSKSFPIEERYSLVDQIRRSSRSVCGNLVEAWRKRRYRAAFIAKLSDAESEACETQVWIEFAFRCKYIDDLARETLHGGYDKIIGQIVRMIEEPDPWLIRRP